MLVSTSKKHLNERNSTLISKNIRGGAKYIQGGKSVLTHIRGAKKCLLILNWSYLRIDKFVPPPSPEQNFLIFYTYLKGAK